jgi:GNAT superfamily N-acetyltransferase
MAELITRTLEESDFPACCEIFDESFDALHSKYELGDGESASIDWLPRTLGHFLGTDPEGGRIALQGDRAVGFASSVTRDDYWFLSFLFVRPDVQEQGMGRRLLEELLPSGGVKATVVESFQPVSTGLYASVGMSPRSVKYWLSGVSRVESLPVLSDKVRKSTLDGEDESVVDELDRSVLGFTRRRDHEWWREDSVSGFAYRDDDRLVGYAYADEESGYIGPVLAVDEQHLCIVVADLIRASSKPSEAVVNLSGESSLLLAMLIRAGARIDDSVLYRFVYCSDDGPLAESYIHHSDWLP